MFDGSSFKGDVAELVPEPGKRVFFDGLNIPSAAFVLAESIKLRPLTYLVYLPTPVEAEDFARDLEFFWPAGAEAGRILLLPGYEVKPFSGESPSQDLVFARLWALFGLLSEWRPLVVVTSAPGALQLSLPKRALSESIELLEAGQEVDREDLLLNLVRAGYYNSSLVQSQGDFSVRGGILDLYPPGSGKPVRAEFFGDFLESLRTFNTLNQRSSGDLPEQIVLPANEIVFKPDMAGRVADRLTALAEKAGWIDLLWAPLTEKISQEQYFPGLESFLPLFYDRLCTIEDYAGPEVVRVVYEPDRLLEAADSHLQRLENHLLKIMAEERPHLPLDSLYRLPSDLLTFQEDSRVAEIRELTFTGEKDEGRTWHFRLENNQDLKALIDSSKAGLLAPLAARVRSWRERGLEIVLACHTEEQVRRLAELLEDYDLFPELELKGRTGLTRERSHFRLVVGFLSSGFVMEALGRAFVTENELFGPKRKFIRRAIEEVKGIRLSSFQDLIVGDFVVHNDHGIGQYLGLVTLEAGGMSNDYLHLSYKGGDKLYVPVDRFGAVTKYVGSDSRAPALDKLGGTSWERVKARVKASIRDMAEDLLKLYASRQVGKGHSFSDKDTNLREFEASFAFEETPDQLAAIEDVFKDMVAQKPMDRLVCGDVGYGKTEVALRASFKSAMDGKQVAVLVPTTILAEQHYQTFAERFKNYPMEVQVLSRFKKQSEQREILKGVKNGQVDLVIGTHRLLSKDVVFKDLGLLIIDEEHRFGVAAKEKLKQLRSEVDVLTLTATPIPRTLHMSLSGIRDLSVIETPPQDRQSVKTYLLKYDEAAACEAISRELDRGGQVFFVHNRVRDIEMLAARFGRLMPLVRFGVAHGQQKERELEDIMLRFLNKEIDVLFTTTIIESGLDFPSANTIIINNADRFGLAQIYQIRGRVGRSSEQAYAYLLVSSPENLTRDARKRLRALMDFSELGAGFKIALHDLQIRGAGNLLGTAQSGQIAAVGYEMYVQLMERTIREIKGEPETEEVEPEMVLGLPAYIPESYVPDTEQRLVHYRNLSFIKGPEELDEIAAELNDRYGPPSLEVENLLLVMELKYWLKKARVKKLEIGRGGLTLSFTPSGPASPEKVLELVHGHKNQAKLDPDGRLFLGIKGLDGQEGLKRTKNILQGLS